jgi:hypothetical protein
VRGAIAIARHEITQRSFLPVAALALGFLPLLVGLLTDGGSDGASGLYYASGGPRYVAFMAIIFLSCIAAFVIGMSLVGRPLHAGQMSFYFTRPIAGRAVVGGKLLGGLLVIAAAQLLIYVPTAAHDMLGARHPYNQHQAAVDFPPVPVIVVGAGLLGIGLVAGVLARSRSRWLLVDLAGIGFVALEIARIAKQIIAGQALFGAGEGIFRTVASPPAPPHTVEAVAWVVPWPGLPDFEEQFHERVRHLGIGLTVAAIVALFAATMAAVVVGRTDRERAHAAMSTTLWSSLLVIGGLGLAISQWGMP